MRVEDEWVGSSLRAEGLGFRVWRAVLRRKLDSFRLRLVGLCS